MNIVFIGAGNIATNLSRIFAASGHTIKQIVNRTASSASALAQEFNSGFSDIISETDTDADVYLICVKDDAIASVIDQMPLVSGLVVHTSGSTSIDIFSNKFTNFGVYYPFQSFSKFRKVDITDTHIFIEANTSQNEEILLKFSRLFSKNVSIVNSKQRLILHVSGVFANNFSNHMYTMAYQLSKKYSLPFEAFFPLIQETAEKIQHRSPMAAQTGPAVRKDNTILEKHRKILNDDKDMLDIYNLLSESIIKFSH